MSKKLLINVVHPEEARVAIVEEGRLVELDIEVAGSEQTRGNVYKGVVVRVEPGLQAAFVDIGLKKLGFLQMGEIHPDCWQWRDDVPEDQRKRRPRIQEILRRGQELIVQVEKGERDMKGAALTSYLSLPGRYMVLMPGSDSAGISRKVESESERKKLKELAAQMEIPEGIGYIMRTEALGKSKTELTKDFKSLLKLNQEILAKAKKTKAPALIYQEHDLVIRTIRDYFTAEIDEVLVDSPEVYQQAKDFFKRTMPKFESLVKLHQERRPIFSRYQLEEQIDQIHEKKVLLKSGGSLVIEPTEALVSIDVNSGKSTGEKGVEDTAFKTNMEAAEEVARQLRLRDLGGLIVIDFIDMRDRKHMADVEKTIKNALKADKARVTVGKISQFGILEMSRQRIKPTLSEASYLECPHCEGRGKVKSVENMAISFLRKVHASAAKGTAAEVRGGLPLEVAYYLLNRKKRDLTQIENDYEIEVTIKGKPSFHMNQLELEVVKRDRPLPVEPLVEEVREAPLAPPLEEVEAAEASAGEEAKGKKKRRRKKKGKPEGELAAPEAGEVADEEALEEIVIDGGFAEVIAAEPVAAQEGEAGPESLPADEHKKKRRRRKRRGAKAHAAEEPTELEIPATAVEEVQVAAGGETVAIAEGETQAEEQKKKRRRRKRRGAKPAAVEGSPPQAAAVTAASETAPAPQAEELPAGEAEASVEEHKKKRRRRKRSAEKIHAAGEPAVQPESVEAQSQVTERQEPAEPAPAPAKKRAPRVAKKTAGTAEEAPLPVVLPPASAEQPVPAAKGKGRSAKAVPEGLPETAVPEAGKKPVRARKPAAAKAQEEPAQPASSEEAKPVRKRTPRKKKEAPPEAAGEA